MLSLENSTVFEYIKAFLFQRVLQMSLAQTLVVAILPISTRLSVDISMSE